MKKNKECCACGGKFSATFNGRHYCSKHYAQMHTHGKILKRTSHDKNAIVDYGKYVKILLYNIKNKIIGSTTIDKKYLSAVSKYKWHMNVIKKNNKYAFTNVYKNSKRIEHFSLHEFLMGKKDGMIICHVDGDGLNNRMKNLRFVARKQSNMNTEKKGYGFFKLFYELIKRIRNI